MPKYIKIVLVMVLLCLQYGCLGWIVEKPTFDLKEVSLTLHSMKKLEAVLTVFVNNPNHYDLTVTSFDYRISLGKKKWEKDFITNRFGFPKTPGRRSKSL